MDLRSTQLKDTYGNLVTIGSVAGAPTTGTLQNGQGTDLTILTLGNSTATNFQFKLEDSTTTARLLLSSGDFYIDADIDGGNNRDMIFRVDGGDESMRLESNGDISFQDTSNNEAFYWDASAGSLGIGTTSPATKFHNVGTTLLGSGTWPTATVGNSASRVAMLSTSDQILVIGNTNGTVGADNGADIYLGATATTSTADMAVARISGRKSNSTSGNKETYLAFSTSTSGGTITERMRIDSSGNVGIGTDSPSANFTVTDGTSAGVLSIGNDDTSSSVRYLQFGETNDYSIQSNANSYLRFYGGGSEAMRIDGSGNLLVNTTSTPTSSAGNIVLGNGTAPTGNATDGVILYAEDVSTSSELKVRDEAGNVTTLSPHNFSLIPDGASEPMAWAYYSERDGKKINVDMLKLARMVESLTGEKLVYEQ